MRAAGALLCRLSDVPDGGACGLPPDARGALPIVLVRRGRLAWAYRDWCPHQGAPLGWRRDRYLSHDARWILCGAHGARFEIETGLCVAGPCVGARLIRVPLRVDAAGNACIAEPAVSAEPACSAG